MSFEQLGLSPVILKALHAIRYTNPTPIQTGAIPAALEGQDVLGCAQTGTGKTAAFCLPILNRLATQPANGIRALILAPTRELAGQIHDSIGQYSQYMRVRSGVLIGGASFHAQENMLRRGVNILVATPGRLCDHLRRGTLKLNQIEVLVLDEADRMLDMGFFHDIRFVLSALPPDRQTLFFSATLPRSIIALTQEMLHEPHVVEVATQSSTPKSVQQIMHWVAPHRKGLALVHLLQDEAIQQAIVFTRTKHGANKVSEQLNKQGLMSVAIHGNKTQSQRRAALQRFKTGRVKIMVATDIAARGLDIVGVSHVINFDAPQAPEDYVHRIGRTGRAQAKGIAISLVTGAERGMIRRIERLTGKTISKQEIPDFTTEADMASAPSAAAPHRRPRGPSHPPQRRRRYAA